MSTDVRVIVLEPDGSVSTMADEVADQSVRAAREAAVEAYKPLDSDGHVEVVQYDEDFDNAVDKATTLVTEDKCLVVIVTDLQGNDLDRAERQLASLDDDFIVLVPVSNQGYNRVWADQLDNKSPKADQIDVITVEGLRDRATAYAEVGPWAGVAV